MVPLRAKSESAFLDMTTSSPLVGVHPFRVNRRCLFALALEIEDAAGNLGCKGNSRGDIVDVKLRR